MCTINSFINRLKMKNKLREVNEEIDLNEAVNIAWEEDGKRAIILNNIKGYRTRSIYNVVYGREAILEALNVKSYEDAYRKLSFSLEKPSKPRSKSITLTHKRLNNINIEDILPLPKFFPKDGGKYITSSIILAGDDEGNYNASIHRMMYIGRNRFAVRIVPRHLYKILTSFIKKHQDLPVVIIIGVHPALMLAASTSPEYGVYEVYVANTLLDNNLHVDTLLDTEIPTPLESEIIMLGRIRYDLKVEEGPFVDITGTYDIVRLEHVLEVDELWISEGDKENPLFHNILPSGVEHKVLMGFPRETQIWSSVRKVVPEVKAVRLTKGGCGWLHAVISIRKGHEGDGKNVILAAFSAHPSLKHVVVVDDDINVEDINDVEWAIATRFRADRDLIVISNVRGSTLDPTSENGLTSKMGIDATAPLAEREKFLRVKRHVSH